MNIEFCKDASNTYNKYREPMNLEWIGVAFLDCKPGTLESFHGRLQWGETGREIHPPSKAFIVQENSYCKLVTC